MSCGRRARQALICNLTCNLICNLTCDLTCDLTCSLTCNRVMQNRELAVDHVRRAQARVRALDVLFEEESWADVVREAQEALELALKGLLRACGVDPPRAHDVADVLIAERERLPERLRAEVEAFAAASRDLRRDRELAFYGAEDLTPSTFYSRKDAERALDAVRSAVSAIAPVVLGTG